MRRGGWGAAAVGCGPVAVGCVARPGWGCACASGGNRQSSCVWTRVRFVSWCTVGCRGGGGETPACRRRLINSPAWAGGGGAVRPCAPSRRAVMPCLSPTACLSRGASQAEPRPGGGGHRGHPTCGGHRRRHRRRDRRHGRRCRHRSRRGAVGGNARGPPERGATAAATAARAADFMTQTKTQAQRRRRSNARPRAIGWVGEHRWGARQGKLRQGVSHRVHGGTQNRQLSTSSLVSLVCASAVRSQRLARPPHRDESRPSVPIFVSGRSPSSVVATATVGSSSVNARSSTAASSLASPRPPFAASALDVPTATTAAGSAVPHGGTPRDAAGGTPTGGARQGGSSAAATRMGALVDALPTTAPGRRRRPRPSPAAGRAGRRRTRRARRTRACASAKRRRAWRRRRGRRNAKRHPQRRHSPEKRHVAIVPLTVALPSDWYLNSMYLYRTRGGADSLPDRPVLGGGRVKSQQPAATHRALTAWLLLAFPRPQPPSELAASGRSGLVLSV